MRLLLATLCNNKMKSHSFMNNIPCDFFSACLFPLLLHFVSARKDLLKPLLIMYISSVYDDGTCKMYPSYTSHTYTYYYHILKLVKMLIFFSTHQTSFLLSFASVYSFLVKCSIIFINYTPHNFTFFFSLNTNYCQVYFVQLPNSTKLKKKKEETNKQEN